MPVIPLVSSDSPTLISSAPFVRTSFGARSFSVAAPKIWNSLPLSLRIRSYLLCTSHDTFRLHLKTHYCQQAFQSTQPLLSCASRSAFADHCARLEIIFTYLLTYLLVPYGGCTYAVAPRESRSCSPGEVRRPRFRHHSTKS